MLKHRELVRSIGLYLATVFIILVMVTVPVSILTYFRAQENQTQLRKEVAAVKALQENGTYGSCVKVNKVIDGLYSLADDRSPFRRAGADTKTLDEIDDYFHKRIPLATCLKP